MLFVKILIAIIAVLHLGIMYLEVFSAPEKQAESLGLLILASLVLVQPVHS